MIHTIPYFDAHCDTIHRCHTAGTPFRGPELRAFYDIAGDLRRSGGHIDLERAGGFSRYAQFFALYQSPRLVPEGSSMPEQGILLHQRFLREMEENRERILPCRTGAEVDEAVRQGKAAALLSIEGAELLDCDIRRLDTAYDWGVRLLNPVWNNANALCLGGRVVGAGLACQIVDAFLNAEFEGGRHQKRIDKMMALENL